MCQSMPCWIFIVPQGASAFLSFFLCTASVHTSHHTHQHGAHRQNGLAAAIIQPRADSSSTGEARFLAKMRGELLRRESSRGEPGN